MARRNTYVCERTTDRYTALQNGKDSRCVAQCQAVPRGDPRGHPSADGSGGKEMHSGKTVTSRPDQGICLPEGEIRKARGR